MTNQDAHEIAKNLIYLEFPLFYDLAVRLALFETYAVENIAKLLVAVSDLNKWDTLPKRYEDTEVVFSCFATFPPTSAQLHKAIARINYLHGPFIASGKIRQEDMLYVLYASMAEPVRFINLFEWRQLDDMEVASIATLWKYIGDMMDIDYKSLLQKEEWTDGIEFLEDVSNWASKYEDQYMRPMKEVHDLGEILMQLLLQSHAKFARPLAYLMALVVMGNRLRRAFGFPEPSLGITVLTYSLLLTRKLVLRFLCLPRVVPVEYVSQPDKITGRIKHYHYMKEPWFVPGTFWSRWNPESLLTWVSGGMIPGDGGAKMKPEGFIFADLGPKNTVGRGIEKTLELEERVRQKATTGCPFALGTKT
ncbi:hypothetical protein AK830_g3933 [Neonectria ditissima]|uniref:ER-bound oxygenase mpaB/mpaB'/Rubber oxygenase catalytic domain-containing protein n=1 Tax=Neonectria ditissima TaxID=78410 RepID=A0A0P7BH36_9HYPO|nr:hypothetical protein AK830_g3933 [Neonectria ditissima]